VKIVGVQRFGMGYFKIFQGYALNSNTKLVLLIWKLVTSVNGFYILYKGLNL